MWVEGGDIHDELLERLGGVLAPPDDLSLSPSAAELDALAVAVAARWPDGATISPVETAVAPATAEEASEAAPVGPLRPGKRPLRRLGSSAWRAGSVAAGLVVFSASAAAANGGVPLPRPVRVVAYNVGLPVDSPALDDTHQHIEELKDAVKAKDKPKAEATVRRLEKDLTKVPADEKQKAEKKVVAVIEQADVRELIESPTPTTTTTAPSPPTTTASTVPAAPTTATTGAVKEKGKEKEQKAPATTTTTEAPATTTTVPEPTTTTTVPETDEPPADSTTTTTARPAEDPTTTTTTVTTAPPPEPTTTTTTSTTGPPGPPADPGPGVQSSRTSDTPGGPGM